MSNPLQNAILAYARNDLPTAEARFETLVEQEPERVTAHYFLGLVKHRLGRTATAEAALQRAGNLFATDPEAAIDLVEILICLRERERAHEILEVCLARSPDHPRALEKKIDVLFARGETEAGLQLSAHILDNQPGHEAALLIQARAVRYAGQPWRATSILHRAIHLQKRPIQALQELAAIHWEAERFGEAAIFLQRALRLDADDAQTHFNLSYCLSRLGHMEEAEIHLRRAIDLEPHRPESDFNLAYLLREQGRYREAESILVKIVERDPDSARSRLMLAEIRLLSGRFQAGWPGLEARWEMAELQLPQRPPLEAQWRGEPLRGNHILLLAEQGYGDAIQYVRYAPLVRERGGRVSILCSSPLQPLFESIPGLNVLREENKPHPTFQRFIPLGSLPGLFSPRPEEIPARVPYLHADPERIRRFARFFESEKRLKVGLVWRGRPEHKNDRQRSIHPELFTALVEMHARKAAFYSLQPDPGGDADGLLRIIGPERDLGGRVDDFADTAALLTQLDLVIAVDTAVVHLAGALNRPCWLLLPKVPDWRWMLDRSDSVWYPGLRLFRQAIRQDWEGVFFHINQALIQRYGPG